MNKSKYLSAGWNQAETVLNGLDALTGATLAPSPWYLDPRFLLLPFLAAALALCCFYRVLTPQSYYVEYVDEGADPELEFKSTGTARGGKVADHATKETNME